MPKDIESGVQREEFFRNPTADKAAAWTLPSGLLEASEVGAPWNRQDASKSAHEARTQVRESTHQGTKKKKKKQKLYDLVVPQASVQDMLKRRMA